MKGDGERDRQIFCGELFYTVDQTAGGEGDMSISDIQTVGRADEVKEFDDVVVIIERFTNAHHDDSVYAFAGISLSGEDLGEHLRGEKSAGKSLQRGRAEGTAHGTSCL